MIKDKLHLVCEFPKGLEDDTEAALINWDQSKLFDRANNRFLMAVLMTVEFEFCTM